MDGNPRRALGNWLVRSPRAWRALDRTVLHLAGLLRGRREALAVEAAMAKVPGLGDELRVRRGPFRGLVYDTGRAHGSVLAAKLLGTYEAELHRVVEAAIARAPDEIVDIGCAEGYYAVGMARRLPEARTLAIDADAEALASCAALARANSVDARVEVRGPVDAAWLAALPRGPRRLVIADCEGAELALFDAPALMALIDAELVIETHDFIDPWISDVLLERLETTHEVEVVATMDDLDRVRLHADLPELTGLDRAARMLLVGERRPAPQRWLCCRPRSPAAHRSTDPA